MNTLGVHRLAVAVGVLVALEGSAGSAGAATSYSGRAYGAQVKLVNPNPNVLFFSDTGQLSPAGGSLSATLLTILLGNTLSSHTITASCSGSGGAANSSASQENVVVFGGQPAQVTASVVASQAHADCAGVSGSSVVTGLTFGGQAVTVTGQPNQTVTLLGIATLIINEQIVPPGARDITVNALHLIVGTGEEVILSSSHSDVGCATGASKPSWGVLKTLYR
jgi:hypothetical protein